MRLSILFAVSCALAFVVPPPTGDIVVDQPIDWTLGNQSATFKQRVLIYDTYYTTSSRPKKERPIFFTPGGEGPVSGGYQHNGLMFEFGEALGALLVFPEHRYYGDTHPFGNASWTRRNIQYLTVEQALADYAHNIALVRKSYGVPDEAPVVAFGGSYPGDLAGLLRLQYPEVFDMALASSAPIGAQLARSGFFRVATESFAASDARCPDIVREAWVEILQLLGSTQTLLELQMRLALCKETSKARLLYLWTLNAFATLTMENYPWLGYPMNQACSAAVDSYTQNGDAIAALSAAVGVVYNATGNESCFEINQSDFLNCADMTGCGSGNDATSWDFQSCTQIEFQMSTTNITDMFPPTPFSQQQYDANCQARWGLKPGVSLGQLVDFSNATNIIFSNGLIDGWEPYGVLDSPNPGSIVTLQYVGAHHEDLYGSSLNDTTSVTKTRELERAILSLWIDDVIKHKQR